MSSVEQHIRRLLYVRWLRPRVSSELDQQRLKLIYDVWGYAPLLAISTITLKRKVSILARFLWIDWNIVHGH